MKPLNRQASTVLSHMRRYPHITQMQADGVYHIRRLASRIDELRAAGYEIETQQAEDAKGQRYTRYSLSKRQRRNSAPLLPPRDGQSQYRIETIREAYELYCRNELGINGEALESDVEDFISYLKGYTA